MHLLDLPPEIFGEVIHAYVQNSHWKYAAKSRTVCKAFAQAIHRDMTSRYPLTRYMDLAKQSRRQKSMLDANIHHILFNMGPTRCRSTYLLAHMEGTVNFLLDFASDKSQGTPLCNTLSSSINPEIILAYLDVGPYPNSPPIRTKMLQSDKRGMLAAAAAVDSLPALRYLLNIVPDLAIRSQLYGTPLLAAATNGHEKAARLLHNHMKETDQFPSELKQVIINCMRTQRATLLPLLIGWYLLYSTKPESAAVRYHCTKWAVEAGNVDVLRLCWTQPNILPDICSLTHWVFERACNQGHKDMVQYVISIGPTIPTSPTKHLCTGKWFCYLTRGLWAAVSHGWLRTAKLLLDQGADVGRTHHEIKKQAAEAVRLAIEGDKVDMVVLLLVYGALVPSDIIGFPRANGVIAKIMRKACGQ
ncbi:Ankyrin repeat-containing domain [Pyrenophora seminiperda CCB06]|uniref:Ankyrin repeat-containing domain n=1 Tax=Pyrenophora seminiperda CCB06 TaxID=1302712 RepID=A0A3M7LWB4_9PLEO|nr:Ankyrin repeat-containing domain [Pyrenophora seminiperda CCB06]